MAEVNTLIDRQRIRYAQLEEEIAGRDPSSRKSRIPFCSLELGCGEHTVAPPMAPRELVTAVSSPLPPSPDLNE